MQHNLIHLTDKNTDIISFKTSSYGKTNSQAVYKMKKALNQAITKELTNKQRQCVIEYYLNGKRMNLIAKEMKIHPSTVTRHIQAAQKRLKHVAGYY